MPRANRHYILGCVWHITHSCHKGEFLLKFSKDRKRWRHWLFEAKKRYGLCVLNYVVTSNHIHLLAVDTGKDIISKSLQLIAGRTAQEYNLRKKRKGAFWDDRYHATAVEASDHLAKCLVYIDLNMVRAGVVQHPSEWSLCGYNEIQNPPERYRIIDIKALLSLFSFHDEKEFQSMHRELVNRELENGPPVKNSLWSESLAFGSESYIEDVQDKLAGRVQGRSLISSNGTTVLKEPQGPYKEFFRIQKDHLSYKNTYFLHIILSDYP